MLSIAHSLALTRQVATLLPALFIASHAQHPINPGTAANKDLVIIGGGVAGYVAAIKAAQEGMKVISFNALISRRPYPIVTRPLLDLRLYASRNAER